MKIKVDAEKLIAKYLLGDLTDPERNSLTIGSKALHNMKSFSIVYAQTCLFVNATKHIHK